jgi:hypothetical protein
MKRSEAWKPLREHGGWMQMSERVVFYALLERADNADCSIPAFMTLSLAQLAEACCCSRASVKAALRHLERHGWMIRKRTGSKDSGKTGRGHKTTFQLLGGFPCAPGCDYWRPSPAERRQPSPVEKGANEQPLYEEKGANERPPKGANEVLQTPRSDPVSDEGLTEGEGKEGTASANGKLPADWSLIRRLVRIVNADPCGGIHRDALAEKLHMPPDSKAFGQALAIATRRGQIDWCGRYAVKVIPKEKWPA